MPKYLDQKGVTYLWSKIKEKQEKNLVYQSNTTENWNQRSTFVSEKNVLYIYTDYKIIEKDGEELILPGLKVGDGQSYLIDLPFLNNISDSSGEIVPLEPATTSTLGGVIVGQDLQITRRGILSVVKANSVEEDNTHPITAAAVYTEIGNINALLATI